MKLTILGSGTYQPEKDRVGSGYLIETGESKICFDFGRGAINRLLEAGIHVNQIDALFMTHYHADHMNDLPSLLHITIAPPADHGLWPARQKPLKIYGPKGTLANIKSIARMIFYQENHELRNLEIRELKKDDSIEIDKIKVSSFLAKHNSNLIPLCYRLESEGKIFAYSGDTVESDGLKKCIQNADLAIVEAAWPDEVKPKTHFTGSRAGKFAAECGVKKLVITHMAPLYLQKYNPKADTKKEFKGEVVVAKDLLEIKL